MRHLHRWGTTMASRFLKYNSEKFVLIFLSCFVCGFSLSVTSCWCFRTVWVFIVSCLPAVTVCLKTAATRWAALSHSTCCDRKDKVIFNYSVHTDYKIVPHWPDFDQNKSSITELVLLAVLGKRRNIQWDVQEVSKTSRSCSDWWGEYSWKLLNIISSHFRSYHEFNLVAWWLYWTSSFCLLGRAVSTW